MKKKLVLKQVGKKVKTPPAGYDFVPFPKGKYLHQLLKCSGNEN
ncbi:MAG TPA: hypothetical protein VFC41_09255 [Anaerovoracaceae bacterium]|nr:hypothetical protein [Anaerovoracaceae bacterium]